MANQIKKPSALKITAIVLLAAIILILYSFIHRNSLIQGYVEGRYTYIATTVSGVLEELPVARGNQVVKGQKLFVLEPQPESDQLTQARERVSQAFADEAQVEADINLSHLTLNRYQKLVQTGSLDKASLDTAQATFNKDQARIKDAQATLKQEQAALMQAQWTQSQKAVYSPVSGVVFDTYYRIGELVGVEKPVLSLLTPDNIQAIFFIPETMLGKVQLGDPIAISCDACANSLQGHISFISPSAEYTPPVIYSNETTSKLVYRIEADLSVGVAKQLHPGQPILIKLLSHHD
jgi:HlyD family secretion protein